MSAVMITVNDVRRAVMSALAARFPDTRVYGEKSAQGFVTPAFFVFMFPVYHTQELGRRYLRRHSFDVHYFPTGDYENDEMHDVAEQLYDVLEIINANGKPIRGTAMRHEIVDGVLHFFVDYSFHVRRELPEVPKMADMEQEGLLK